MSPKDSTSPMKEIQSRLRQTWGRLEDNDILNFQGDWEDLATRVGNLYGITPEQATREVQNFRDRFRNVIPL